MDALKSLLAARDQLRLVRDDFRKAAFQPMSALTPGGGAPMDPSAGAAAGPGGAPMDPSMMVAGGAGAVPPQAAAPAPQAQPPVDPSQLMEVMGLVEQVVQQVEMLGQEVQQIKQFMASEFANHQREQAEMKGELNFLLKTLKEAAPPPDQGLDPATMAGGDPAAMADPAALPAA